MKLKCIHCNVEFETIPSRANERKYCSRGCVWKHRRKLAGFSGPTKRDGYRSNCKVCGKDLSRDQKTYCGWECAGKDLRRGKEKVCPICGKSEYVKPAVLKHWKTCSRECDRQYKIEFGLFAGENNPAWRGGYQSYYGPNWKRQRRKARERDNFTCRICGLVEQDQEHDVHHIRAFREFGYIVGENDHYREANKLSNLITLCRSCHIAVENGAPLEV